MKLLFPCVFAIWCNKMSREDLRKLRFLVLVMSVFVLGANAFRQQILSEEEEFEINIQLKQLNKLAIMSFKTEFGDIIDCVDIYKQPSLDHPLLKNHTIQLKPTVIPKGRVGDASKAERLMQHLPNINSCPSGSVPIKRTTKEDLIAAKSFKPMWSDRATPSSTIDAAGYHVAILNYKTNVYGAKCQINLWNPIPSMDQFSSGSMWLSQGFRNQQNTIQVGWSVQPKFFQNVTRLTTYWTADGYQNTGCYNQLCPGFVQIDPKIRPGLPLGPISTYNGPQFDIPVSVHQDSNTGNWLLMFGNKYIGYWPKGVLPGLESGGIAAWGGEVYSPTTEGGPAMGSGHFPEEGFKKTAFVNQIQVVHFRSSRDFVDPNDSELSVGLDKPVCFGLFNKFTEAGNWGRYIFYGGPKGCK